MPCPKCGDPQRDEASSVRPGGIYICNPCQCFLVVTTALTLARATNDDLCRLPIREQYVARAVHRMWLGIPHGDYC